ncbi:MAG: hypothetical protein HYS57_00505 [Parcubacteria group bacterium]|nr:hypothetical protein [Parcubacteria group bacterium]
MDACGLREQLLEAARLSDPFFVDLLRAQEDLVASLRPQGDAASRAEFKTTVIAFPIKDGGIIAADSRATLGNRPMPGTFVKLFQLDAVSSLGISGFAGDGQLIARILEREWERFENRYHPPHPKSKANRVARLLRAFGSCMPIFVTFDRDENHARIFSYDSVGSMVEQIQGYAIAGSGSLPITSEVQALAPIIAGQEPEEAFRSVVYLLRKAALNDLFTEGDFLVHVVTAGGVAKFVEPWEAWRAANSLEFVRDAIRLEVTLQRISGYLPNKEDSTQSPTGSAPSEPDTPTSPSDEQSGGA